MTVRGTQGQWLVPNAAALSRLVSLAGFDVDEVGRPTVIPFGAGHPARGHPWWRRRANLVVDAALGGRGLPVRAVRSHPAV